MPSNKISDLSISFMKRNARKRGPNLSMTWNDSVAELSQDLAGLYDQWNNRLVPLIAPVPDGTVDSDIDAYANGLDGRTLYVNFEATNSLNSLYYHTSKSRPNTILEQFDNIYTAITSLKEDLQGEVASIAVTAEDISISDSGGLFVATNVEDSLAEVMTVVNNFADGAAYLPLAGGAMLGTLDMNNQRIQMYPNVYVISGTGTPEGNVVAAVGSLFLRRDAPNAAEGLYFKYTGTGNTGWSAR